MIRDLIEKFYEVNEIEVSKIRRARLDDGYFVYHKYTMDGLSEFIPDDSEIYLEIAVMEARNRAGKGSRLERNLYNFLEEENK